MKQEPITMPDLSDTMETGHLSSWQKSPGDKIKTGDVLAEIESDKAVMDVEAFSDGYLAGPLTPAGSDIPVGAVIGYIVDSADATNTNVIEPKTYAKLNSTEPKDPVVSTPQATARKIDKSIDPPITETKPAPQKITREKPPASTHAVDERQPRPKISPYARGLATELGIDPVTIKPGTDGIIRSPQVIKTVLQGPLPELDAGPPWHYKLLTPMHRAIAENMSATVSTPTFRITADLSLKPLHEIAKQQHYSLSLLLARALALSVKAHPQFNAIYTPNGLAIREQVDVGIAVDIPGGLVTPVINDAAKRSLTEIAEDWRILKNKAKNQRLTPADYQGATVYLSNLGMFGSVKSFEAIVPLGSAAILAVGAAQNDFPRFTLSCDHRVVLGADAARLIETFAGLLASPGEWIK
jgi:pyruvate dehydrogenase E2 component (dihydrolipoamide acetyltransferase)